jgi:hypothetical protein
MLRRQLKEIRRPRRLPLATQKRRSVATCLPGGEKHLTPYTDALSAVYSRMSALRKAAAEGFISTGANDRGRNDQAAYPSRKATIQPRFLGSLLRFVFAKSLSCFSDIDFSICFEAPLRLDFGRFPRFAANAAPAAICCFFEVAGIPIIR